MTQTQRIETAKKMLQKQRARLSRALPANDAAAVQLDAEHRPEELAQNAEISDVLVQLSERESAVLVEVDAALRKIGLGTWGECEKCHAAIASARMSALPEARTCATCSS